MKSKSFKGNWYGDDCYFGIHHDLHVLPHEINIGEKLNPEQLAEVLGKCQPDLLQTDSKGHEGLNSFCSEVPGAEYPAELKNELLVGWRKAADILNVPLHCHHSGIEDELAVTKNPSWAALEYQDGKYIRAKRAICPRSPYVEKNLFPR